MSMHSYSPLGKLRWGVAICCVILILGIIGYAYLTDKNDSVIEKNEILEKVETLGGEDYGYTYVSSYVKKYGIENVNTYKINNVESYLESNYYKALPEERELAKNIALLFVEHFYDNIDLSDKTAVTDAVLTCLFASIGDPYAYYRNAKEFEEYVGSLEGGNEFVGIGVLMNQDTLEILMVYPDSGAKEAGIMPHDIIIGVDGKTVETATNEELLDMVRGEVGSTVKVTVNRGGEIIEFTVTRKVLTERSVLYDMSDEKVGYIQITQFLKDTPAQFKEAVDYCEEMGAVALVIDVRYNPGGLLNSVVDVIDYITPDLPTRRIASYTESGNEYVFYTDDGHSVDIPIAVICNSGTASAGELFTAAMRDYGEAKLLKTVIIGKTTYGKGVAQNSYTLYDKSGITYTIGYFNPPSDVNFDGVGVIPDVEVEEESEKDAPLEKAYEKVLELANVKGGIEINLDAAA
jgi:carboxyl-terminal processing protease